MRRWLACSALAFLCAVPAAMAAGTDVNLNFYPFAARTMTDHQDWDPIQDQYAFGGTIDFARHGAPIHFALGLHGSAGVEDFSNPLIDQEAGLVAEFSFGVTKVWEPKGHVRPFLGGGVSFVNASVEFETVSGTQKDDDDSLGLWIEGGVYWRIGPHVNCGLFGRALGGTSINLFGEDGDADYWEIGPMVGWSWPPQKD